MRYIVYAKTDPFPGYLAAWGKVDINEPADGSTVKEWIDRALARHADWAIYYNAPVVKNGDRETKKFDPATHALVDQEPEDVTPSRQREIDELAKTAAIASNLPAWDQVSAAVDAISNLPEAKDFLKKLARVVYWMAKGSPQ